MAIDGEFTGILSFDKMNYFDTPAERYQRHYEVNQGFRLILVIRICDSSVIKITLWYKLD